MTDEDRLADLAEEIAKLEDALGGAQALTASFAGELGRVQASLRETSRGLGDLEAGLSRGLRRAFDGVLFDGMRLSSALGMIARAMADTAYAAAMRPVTNHLGGLLAEGLAGLLPFRDGAPFSQGRVIPFAQGGVVPGPATFAMRGAVGLMGEAGPEAILPLARGADGRLGVRAQGGGGAVNVTVNIATPDVQGFQRSQAQIAAQLGRAIRHGQRNR